MATFNSQAISSEAYGRAVQGQSVMNYAAIFEGFLAKGIPESEIKPRENVFTFWAWKAIGRRVKKGEHGVKATTWVSAKGKESEDGEPKEGFRFPRTVTVFHVTQTELEPGASDTLTYSHRDGTQTIHERVQPAKDGPCRVCGFGTIKSGICSFCG